jgi:transposase
MVYGMETLVREQGLDPTARLQFHQQYSGPLMDQLHQWLEEQLAEARTEPNSGLGKANRLLAESLATVDAVSTRTGRTARQQPV